MHLSICFTPHYCTPIPFIQYYCTSISFTLLLRPHIFHWIARIVYYTKRSTQEGMISGDQFVLQCHFSWEVYCTVCKEKHAEGMMSGDQCILQCPFHCAVYWTMNIMQSEACRGMMSGDQCSLQCPFHCEVYCTVCKEKHAGGDDVRGSDIRAFQRAFHYPPSHCKKPPPHHPYHLTLSSSLLGHQIP